VDVIQTGIEILIHLDQHVAAVVDRFGGWSYAFLFLIIFCETGLVVTPFLPGDSLLFAAGALAGDQSLDILALTVTLCVAAILGDSVNYWVGAHLGTRIFKDDARVLKTSYLQKTEAFFEKYGGKTIVVARFVPIVRTYAPFMAGVARMRYGRFLTYNVVGGVVWILSFLWGGYFFGGIPFVERNFALVIIVVIALSLIPMLFEYAKARRGRRAAHLSQN